MTRSLFFLHCICTDTVRWDTLYCDVIMTSSASGYQTTGGIGGSATVPMATGIEFGPGDRSQMSEKDRHKYNGYYRKLKNFRDQLPSHLLLKLSSAHLRELATSLMDGTVFEIVGELEDIQKLTERSLLKTKMEVVNRHKGQKVELSKQHHQELVSAEELKPHTLPLLKKQHKVERDELEEKLAEEMRSVDKKIVLELDQLVADQQSTMQQCAMPLFTVTNCPQDVQLQMYLLRFLRKMSAQNQKLPPSEQ